MEKKNTILLTVIAVATLLVAVVGATFAYFTATNTGEGASNTATATTAKVAAIAVTSSANKQAYLEYPGGVSVLAAGVNIKKDTATAGSTSTVAYNVNLKYKNNTGTDLNYAIYTAEEAGDLNLDENLDAGCSLKVTNSAGKEQYAYTCTTQAAGFSSLGTAGKTGTLDAGTSEEQSIQVATESITVNSEDAKNNTKYYYVVVDYPSTGDQTLADSGKEISLTIEVTEPVITTTQD